MYLINPPLVTALGPNFPKKCEAFAVSAGNNFNALGNKTNTIIKNENTRR